MSKADPALHVQGYDFNCRSRRDFLPGEVIRAQGGFTVTDKYGRQHHYMTLPALLESWWLQGDLGFSLQEDSWRASSETDEKRPHHNKNQRRRPRKQRPG